MKNQKSKEAKQIKNLRKEVEQLKLRNSELTNVNVLAFQECINLNAENCELSKRIIRIQFAVQE